MNGFNLKKHSVINAFFRENTDKEKKTNFEVGVEGGILVPKDREINNQIAIQLKFHFGNSDDRIYLKLETLTIFVVESVITDISEESIKKACLPIALSKIRETVKSVTEAYGMLPIDLPPFEEENV